MSLTALQDLLRTPRGRRVLIAVPDQIRSHAPVAKAVAGYERLVADEQSARAELETLGGMLKKAEQEHLDAYAAALAAGKPTEPSETKTIKIRDEHAKLGRRLAATTLAIDDAEVELAATVVAERERLLSNLLTEEQASVERTRAAVEELAEARAATMSARAIRNWLGSFPAGASRSVTAGTPPVRTLLGRNHEPIAFAEVIAALLAEITPPAPATPTFIREPDSQPRKTAEHATAAGF